MPAAIRVIFHIAQAIFLVLAVAGAVVLGLEWLIDLERVSNADVEDLRPAVLTLGILSVAFSPILWSTRRRSVETAPAPSAVQPLPPPHQFQAPPPHQFQVPPPPQQQPAPQQPPQQPVAGYGSAPVATAEQPTRPAPGGHSAQVSPAAPPAGPTTGASSDPTEAASPPRWPAPPP